jgi:tRNA U38,U39,U40 pseudouridine synthase TruA
VIELSSEALSSGDTTEVFSLDGVTYTMPAEPRPSIGLRFVWEMKTGSEMDAVANLLISTVGREAFEALTRAEGMTAAQWEQLQQIVIKQTVGATEPGKGQ